jgi:hypothetical protein
MMSPGLSACSVADAHGLERARAEALDEHLRAGREPLEQVPALRLAQGERHALLVAGVDLPVSADPVDLPVAQRVALAGILDLDHLGAEVGELQAQHVAGHQPRQVEHADAVERAPGVGMERPHGTSYRR